MISLTKLLTFFDLTRNPAPAEPAPRPAKVTFGTQAAGYALAARQAWVKADLEAFVASKRAETYGGEGRA